MRGLVTGFVLIAAMLPACNSAFCSEETIGLASDGKSFVLQPSGTPFVPYGFNYAPRNEMLEDHWDVHWPEIEQDFREMKELGANVVRIHLQVPMFMESADTASSHSLQKLSDILALAQRNQLYLDITGLACYKPRTAPAWYDALEENERWESQGHFWTAIAETCTSSTAVFCYDLMNEPISPGEKRGAGKWYSGELFGGFDFVQFISLDPKGRPREEVARDWIRQLKAAIRRRDQHHLVTVGMLPWDREHKYLSGFVPETVAPEIDFVSVHIYPHTSKLDEAMECLQKFAVGKPVVIEETFPLTCSAKELRAFMLESRGIASGWIGHYFGDTTEDLHAKKERALKDNQTTEAISQHLLIGWLELFRDARKDMVTEHR